MLAEIDAAVDEQGGGPLHLTRSHPTRKVVLDPVDHRRGLVRSRSKAAIFRPNSTANAEDRRR